jgi:outer membrane protein assembly factor BamA
LRGYSGDEPQLRGANARVASVEWRFPIADIDRHAMAPPLGLGRISGTVLFDMGGAWNAGHRPDEYWHSVGIELLGELKLFYATGLQLRLGAARGLDGPRDTQGYLSLGRSF